MEPILSLEGISKYYVNGKNVVAGLNKVSLSFYRGEFAAITGESGSGKSTLAHILGGILPYEDGELYIEGKPTSHYDSSDWEAYRRDNIAFISQNYGILPGSTVLDNVVSALYLTGMSRSKAAVKAKEILEVVELWSLRHRRAVKLSSGQKQRLAIARALAKPCPILIADEPTGNLDPENSEKVIKLLAQAAKERLVILITHEFSEASEYVTRHIRVHDGRVAGDMQCRPSNEVQSTSVKRKVGSHGIYTAFLQLRSRPVWSVMVLMFFALTAFAVFAFLGTFIVALDDTSTRIYDNEAFMNGDKTRIVAVRKDGGDMTQEDYDTILSLKYVESLERYGYIRDVSYSYLSGTDYEIHYSIYNVGSLVDPSYLEVGSVEVLYSGKFVQTMPLLSDDSDFLTAGHLPEGFYEVVAGNEALLGQVITVYLHDFADWADHEYIKLDVTVVGTTDVGKGLYFSDEVGAMLTLDYLGTDFNCIPYFGEVYSGAVLVPERSADHGSIVAVNVYPSELNAVMRGLKDSEKLVSLSRYSLDCEAELWDIPNNTTYDIAGYKVSETVGVHDSTLQNVLAISPTVFSAYIEENLIGCGDQVSITISDYAYTDRVISALEKAGYYALSPYVLGSTKVNSKLEAQRQQTQIVCLGALLAVIILQMLLLRALFSMENDSYRVLSNIGLTWRSARRSVYVQIFVFTFVGQLLGFGGILLGDAMGISRIHELTVYLYDEYWLILSAVHWVSAFVSAKFILKNLRKSVYPLSAGHSDLAPRSKEAAR